MTYQLVTLLNEEEEIAFKEMKKVAMKKCDPAVLDFVNCTRNKTFSGFILCRPMLNAMNECLSQFTTEEVRDGFRTELYQKKFAKMEQQRTRE